MDDTSIGSLMSASTQGMQQLQGGHHHHRMSMSQRIDKMETAIDKALQDGKLSSDQATDMKKQLDDIKKTLADAKTSGTQLTDDQRKQIRETMQGVGKELFAAIAPSQETDQVSQNAAAELFKKLDTNGDGNIDKNEFASFVNQLSQSGATSYFNPSSYNQQGTLSVSTVQQSTITLTA